jgi:hypothetical protein
MGQLQPGFDIHRRNFATIFTGNIAVEIDSIESHR